jgi:hypothetical protein
MLLPATPMSQMAGSGQNGAMRKSFSVPLGQGSLYVIS